MKKIVFAIAAIVAGFTGVAQAEESGRLACAYESGTAFEVSFHDNWSRGYLEAGDQKFAIRNMEWNENVAYGKVIIKTDGRPEAVNYAIAEDRFAVHQDGEWMIAGACERKADVDTNAVHLESGNGTHMWIYKDQNQVWVTSNSKYFKKQVRFIKEGQNTKIAVKFANNKVKYKRSNFDWVKPANIEVQNVNGLDWIIVTDAQVAELELDVARYMVIGAKTGFNFWWQRIDLAQVN